MEKFSHDWIDCVGAGFAVGVMLGAMLVGEDGTVPLGEATMGVVGESVGCPRWARLTDCNSDAFQVVSFPKLSAALTVPARQKGVAVFSGRIVA